MQENETKPPRRKLPLGVWIAIAGAVLVFGVLVLGILATLVVPKVLQKYGAATWSAWRMHSSMTVPSHVAPTRE